MNHDIQGTLEQLRNRAEWALKLTYANPPLSMLRPFSNKEQALEHQLKILDSIVQDYIRERGQ